jgi:hypothetical protein
MLERVAGIDHARSQAQVLLEKFGVESPEHLRIDDFARQLGVELVETEMNGAEAQMIAGPEGATIVLPDRSDRAERRWSIAHELGHFVLVIPRCPPASSVARDGGAGVPIVVTPRTKPTASPPRC